MQQFQVIRDFEKALADYTGAPFVTCVNSCTMALRLCFDYMNKNFPGEYSMDIPRETYISVPIQAKRAGYKVKFNDDNWKGMYRIHPFKIYDAARRFRKNMYHGIFAGKEDIEVNKFDFMCVSFHYTKILGLGHGGAILHNTKDAVHFFNSMRHDGRSDGFPITNDTVRYLGHHCPMSVDVAANGLVKLAALPDWNEDLPNSDYPDLSTFKVFK